jgi:hypothetical protein
VGYVKNVWVNGDESKPLDQIRMNHIEDGIFTAAATADSAAASAADAQTELTGRLSEATLNGLYPVYLVWDGAAYPTRVDGAVNIFFGPTDPGLLMEEDDFWADSAVTTLDAVTAATLDTSTAMYAAVQTVTNGDSVTVPMRARSGESVTYQSVGIAGSGLYGWQLDNTTDEGLSGDVRIPHGWNVARVRIIFVYSTAGTGDIRFERSAVAYRDGGSVSVSVPTFHTAAAGTIDVVKSFLHTGNITLTAYDHVNINIRRMAATSVDDTLDVPIYILGVRLEKVS